MTPETAVLISIRPKWCELIACGEKILEVRKSRPAIKPPFTCYIYCTRGRYEDRVSVQYQTVWDKWRGRIIGEFVCDEIQIFKPWAHFTPANVVFDMFDKALLKSTDVWKYSDNGSKDLYGWHISGLHIYKNPLDLSALSRLDGEPVKRAPQSWQYVERKDGT